MSIAVSALVRPSRAVRVLLGACGLAYWAAALAVGVAMPERFPCAPLQALPLAAAGAVLLGTALARVKTQRIDISGTGDLRVTVQQDVGGGDTARASAAMHAGTDRPDMGSGPPGERSVLLPGSVVWPALMSVRHATPGAPPRTLLIARDSVDGPTWRALAVALAVVGRAGMRTTDAKTR